MSTDNTHSNGNNSSPYSDDGDSDAQGYYARPANSPQDDSEEEEEEPGEKIKPISALRAKRIHDDAANANLLPRKKPHNLPSNPSKPSPQVNLDELMATTYAKGFSILNQKHAASASKSSKKSERPLGESKKPPGWTPDDEMTLAKVLIGCSSGGQVQMGPFYERAHDALPETSNSQVYDKMRRMRSRFWQIQTQLRDAGIPEERFPFRTPHESKLYIIWKQIWGDEQDRGKVLANGNGSSAADKQMIVADLVSSDDGDQNQQQHYANNNTNHHRRRQHSPIGRAVDAQVRNCVQAAVDDSVNKIESLKEKSQTTANLGFGVEIGAISKRMREIMDFSRFPNAFPGLDGPDGRFIRQKWRRLQFEELRLFSNRLELLQDECRLCLKRLEGSSQLP